MASDTFHDDSAQAQLKPCVRWGAEWYSNNHLDGETRHLIFHLGIPALFKTRREARAYIHKHYGYIKNRPDLRREPHGWRLPRPIRVEVSAWNRRTGE